MSPSPISPSAICSKPGLRRSRWALLRSTRRTWLAAFLTGKRKGYIFLISVLIIGAMAIATTISLLLLGLASQQSGFAILQSSQAWEYAQTCVERALYSLKTDPYYIGEQTFTFTYGTCRVLSIGGANNVNRTICTEGVSGDSIRRVEAKVSRLLPTTQIETWREVTQFTYCQ